MNLFFTIINFGYKDFAINFFKRWQELGMKSEIIFMCTDKLAMDALGNQGAKCFMANGFDQVSQNLEIWQTKKYKDIVFAKLDITKDCILQYSEQCNFATYIDTDVWINYDFLTEFNNVISKNDFDIIFQDGEDYLINSDDCSYIDKKHTIKQIRNCTNCCTGFMCFNLKSRAEYIELFDYQKNDLDSCSGNQDFINKRMRNNKYKSLVLPKSLFPNFSTSFYFKNLDQNKYWMLHYNFLMGKEKVYYMKKNGHWII